ncbi:MAG: hypothetical protein IJK54_07385, partial [Clostridia bacterium]|nr:hypothetical protein [Clostridia bacterium]
MENNDNKRKKKVISGTASLNRRDDNPVETNGPAGRKDGYQGRKSQYGAQKPAGSGSSGQSGSLLSSLFGGGQQSQSTGSQGQQTQNTQQTFTAQDLGGSSGGSTGGTTGTTGAGKGLLKGGCMKIVLIVLAVVLLFFLIRCIFGGSSCSMTDMLSGDSGIVDDFSG